MNFSFITFLITLKEGNDIERYQMYDKKLRRRPLMTLIFSVVGAHFDDRTDDRDNTTPIYKYDEEDDASPFYSRPSFVLELVSNYLLSNFHKY